MEKQHKSGKKDKIRLLAEYRKKEICVSFFSPGRRFVAFWFMK